MFILDMQTKVYSIQSTQSLEDGLRSECVCRYKSAITSTIAVFTELMVLKCSLSRLEEAICCGLHDRESQHLATAELRKSYPTSLCE